MEWTPSARTNLYGGADLLWEVLLGSMRKPSSQAHYIPTESIPQSPLTLIIVTRQNNDLITIRSLTWCTSLCSSLCTARTGRSSSASSTGTPFSPQTRPPSLSRSASSPSPWWSSPSSWSHSCNLWFSGDPFTGEFPPLRKIIHRPFSMPFRQHIRVPGRPLLSLPYYDLTIPHCSG